MSDTPDNFDENFEKFERQREIATAMVQFKAIFDSMVAAGFSEKQALLVITNMLVSGTK